MKYIALTFELVAITVLLVWWMIWRKKTAGVATYPSSPALREGKPTSWWKVIAIVAILGFFVIPAIGRFLIYNPSLCRALGITPAVGQSSMDLRAIHQRHPNFQFVGAAGCTNSTLHDYRDPANASKTELTIKAREGGYCDHWILPYQMSYGFFTQKSQKPGDYVSVWCNGQTTPRADPRRRSCVFE